MVEVLGRLELSQMHANNQKEPVLVAGFFVAEKRSAYGRFLPAAQLFFQSIERLLPGKADIRLLDYLRSAADRI